MTKKKKREKHELCVMVQKTQSDRHVYEDAKKCI